MVNAQLGAVVRHIRNLAAVQNICEQTDGALLRAFLSSNDQAAFGAVVRRHGPMVMRVCLRTLGNAHDAEDAFQASFLVLAQKASSIRKRESLSSWLHGVAYRMATHAKRDAARRRGHESRASQAEPRDPALCAAWQEIQVLLDQEIEGLPETLRGPFVSCCLENKSCAETARQLGLEEGTVWNRLGRARKLLQKRLKRRGVSLTAVLAAVAVGANGATAGVSRSLVGSIVQAATQIASGRSLTGGPVSAKVIALTEGVKHAMFLAKCKTLTLALLCTAFVGAGLGLAGLCTASTSLAPPPVTEQAFQEPANEGRKQEKEQRADAPTQTESNDDVKVRGRVLDPTGKPFVGAKIYLSIHAGFKKPTYPVRATSGDDGRFDFTVAKSELDKPDSDDRAYRVLAVAKDHGCGWATVVSGAEELTLRLVKDAPVKGRILDPDGRPVAGAKLTVTRVSASKGDADAGGWVGPLPGGAAVLRTDKDGRFELNGVGPDRAVILLLEGPGIATAQLNASGTKFEYQAAASRPIRGVVRDKDTGKPLPGATVSAAVEAVTDTEGRYELLGLAKAPEYGLKVTSAEGNLHFQRTVRVQDTPGLGPVAADVELVRGRVIVSGKVMDKLTGKPVAGAKLEYYPLEGNDTANLMDRLSYPRTEATTAKDGTYTVAGMPGPGVIGVTGPKRDLYMPAWVTAKELKDLFKIPPIAPRGGHPWAEGEVSLAVAVGGQLFRALDQPSYNALVLLQPGERDKALVRDVALEMPQERKGRVLGPDGKALTGVTVWGLSGMAWSDETLKGDEFTVRRMNPRAPRALAFHHKDKNLGLALKELTDEKSGPLTVTLRPCGSLSGQVVDRDSRPLPAFRLDITPSVALGRRIEATTDEKGHFRAEGLIPGMEYTFWLPRQRAIIGHSPPIESGKDKDLGDVKGER